MKKTRMNWRTGHRI